MKRHRRLEEFFRRAAFQKDSRLVIDSGRVFRPFEWRASLEVFMVIQNPNQLKASAEFTQTIISLLSTGRGVHAETAISAASRMAGTFALRSCGLPMSQFT